MSITVKDHFPVIAAFLWIGFVAAISFMEAWLKFRAPGVNLQIGLGIGRLVFQALNKVEWVFAIVIIAAIFFSQQNFLLPGNIWFYIPLFILIIQTLWLLPALDRRVDMHLRGEDIPKSFLHIYYVTMELVKVITLFIFGIKQFK